MAGKPLNRDLDWKGMLKGAQNRRDLELDIEHTVVVDIATSDEAGLCETGE